MSLRCKDMIGSRAFRRVFALSVVLTIALASAALADEVTNRIDNSPDAALENITLNEGATQTVAFRVTVQGNDDDSGCNIDSGEQLTVEVSSSDTSVATVSPQTITFTSCNQEQSLTVTALVKGTATITVAQAPEPGSNTTGSGTFDYDPASFTVTVNAPPTISDIPDQITDEDSPTGDIPFTVGDAETTASDLTVTGSSSNTTLVPNGNISFGGSGANRTVKATPAANRSGTATITVSVSDGLATTSDTFVLTLNPVDDPPEIDLNGGAAGKDYSAVFTEDVGPVAIVNRNTLTVTDIDSNNLASATVTITNLKDANAESLAADTAGTSIIATYDATTGELSLTGAAPMADYQSVLRTVTYDNASQNPDTTDRSVTFVVNDGATSSNTATSTVKVNTVNDAPTVAFTDGPIEVAESGTEVRTYTFEITDPDSTVFSFASGYPDCGGTGELVGTPQISNRSFECRFPDGPASPTVRIQVTDSQGANSNIATRDVEVANVTPEINAPSDQGSNEGEDKSFDLGFFTDPGIDGPWAVSVDWGDGLSNTFAADSPGTLGQRPHTYDDNGTYTVMVTVTEDGTGTPPSSFGTFQVAVSNVAPSATFDVPASVDEGDDISISLTDPSDPSSADAQAGFQYAFKCGGADYDQFGARNGASCSTADEATVTVKGKVRDKDGGIREYEDAVTVNHDPTITTIANQAINEDGSTGELAFSVDDSDVPAGSLTVTASSNKQALVPDGNIVLGGAGADRTARITPAPNANSADGGDARITLEVQDGDGGVAASSILLKVRPVNDKPSFIKGADPSIPEDAGRKEFPGWAADISPGPANESNQTVWFEVSNLDASKVGGTMFSEWPWLSPNGTLTFTSANNANGEITFGMKLIDDGGRSNGGENASDEQWFKVTIRPKNDHPTIELIKTGGAKKAREGETKTYDYKVEDVDEPDPIAESCGARGKKIDTPARNSFGCFFPDGPGTSIVSVRAGVLADGDEVKVTVANVAPETTLNGPSKAKKGQTKTYKVTVDDSGDDAFAFAAGYPDCGEGSKLVAKTIGANEGSFRCEFRRPVTTTVALRVKDSDGALSDEVVRRIVVTGDDGWSESAGRGARLPYHGHEQ